jgi:Repeat of Unknown Function (DUF347)
MITALFWIMKILATTLGETGGDLVAQTLNVGYFGSPLLFITLFANSLVAQLRAKKFHPALFWAVILATSTAGTTMSDFMCSCGTADRPPRPADQGPLEVEDSPIPRTHRRQCAADHVGIDHPRQHALTVDGARRKRMTTEV